MTKDGKVVHSNPYTQTLKIEKWEEIENVETCGTDAMPLFLADLLSR
jgi:hypothetical protein